MLEVKQAWRDVAAASSRTVMLQHKEQSWLFHLETKFSSASLDSSEVRWVGTDKK